MTDTTIDAVGITPDPNSALAWFVNDIHSLPFEGRSAIIDIARMIVNAAGSDDDERESEMYQPSAPVVKQELFDHPSNTLSMTEAREINWDPEFAGFMRAVQNMTTSLTSLAKQLGTEPMDSFGRVIEPGARIIGKVTYDVIDDGWLTIPENSLGFDHPRAIFQLFVGSMQLSPRFDLIGLFDRTNVTSGLELRKSLKKMLEYITEFAFRHSPYRGTAHSVTVGRGGIVPSEVLDLSSELRKDLFLDKSIWRQMDDQMKVFGPIGDTLEKAKIRTSRGILLQGWPGCGKTKMVRVYANELADAGVTVIITDTAAAQDVGDVINYAKTFEKAVVVLEDIDSVVSGRGTSALSEFLNAMDGVSQQNRIVTIATTNDGTALDPAAVRPGRIDTVIDIGTLNLEAVTALLEGLGSRTGHSFDSRTLANIVLDRKSEVTGAMLEGLVLSAMLKHNTLTTENLIDFIQNDWVTGDPRRSFLDVYDEGDDEDDDEETDTWD